ncbi:hypothetical protein A3D80_03520 [Candidatus Roizmanbacteria bacterium RIFCSPHIGHO2_02_FULL_40_13b]|uniref:Uncharacterized protein n=1 Tax=Candidatus Roizmanbacteria bacterium RIFCSPHIGHO2_01_FULL_39_24 TaxID=1802032 RepID=A0A1F7GJ51_9BACT|nr:MAG: hypothetical protein A2799_04290 [Candidatus Roizmanbacteria bacterium RIFCSPHIGHO2_01_FULL_39_24]OGK27035.1 MAG: hypothetical protein A3D80_03520 [Candidatus Roizmanbacteria bacterium RIFCSPHIGHO2_02_FULL_40_13b]OGK48809.1 MAG: hypothetical protein A3A56_01200 [Candidatus Roizmanbacteria bacterium RIFCSPLOWO2_01_FULL_40_32]OGK57301.1 MAG: hypothetical protein A3H83_00190 [Candidatus Roizmanbacteria bacterium RIFCSPLOWO2_02_FULL_39_8]
MINSSIQTTETKELAFIRLKREYKAFTSLVKDGKFTTAMISARILGVSRATIAEWLKTPRIQQAMDEEVDNYISKIKEVKDWKASAYLLDKLDNDKGKESGITDLSQLIVINTVPQETSKKVNLQIALDKQR